MTESDESKKQELELFDPKGKAFELLKMIDARYQEQLKTEVFPPSLVEIGDVIVEGEVEGKNIKLVGTWASYGGSFIARDDYHFEKGIEVGFLPDPDFFSSETVRIVNAVLRSFYGEPIGGPPEDPYSDLIYKFRVGTRNFVDEYFDDRTRKDDIPIIWGITLRYDFNESCRRRREAEEKI